MRSLTALVVLLLVTVASFGASAPELKLREAIDASDKYIETTKYIPDAFFVSSAVLTTEKDGRKTWHLRYEPIKPTPRKDAWFIVVVEMSKSCGITYEE